jgi:Tfp pilus assembly protein PilO
MALGTGEGETAVEKVKADLRAIIVNACLVLLCGLLFAFWIMPMHGAIRQMNRAIKEQRSQLNQLTEQIEQVRKLRTEYNLLCKLVGSPVRAPERGKLSWQLVSDVSELCLRSGLQIDALHPYEASFDRDERLISLPVEVTATGTLEALSRFLFELRKLIPITVVDRMAIQMSKGGSEKLQAQMRIVRFVMVERKASGER